MDTEHSRGSRPDNLAAAQQPAGRIPIAGPWITRREVDYVTDAVTNGWYGQATSYIQRLEARFSDHLGIAHAVALPSATSGLHLSLAALGVGPGDEVIVAETTWIASSAAISYVGATPVFADVDPRTWCLSPESFSKAITPRTRAVIAVDIYGNMADYDAILEIARKHGIKVVEDAAEAVGSTYKGRPAGTLGDVGVFSFHGSKTLSTGEGGMLVTADDELRQRVDFLRDHGRVPGDSSFINAEVAFKYKMSNLQAAIGLAQVERMAEIVARKRRIFEWYRRHLGGVDGIRMNDPGPDVESDYWLVSIVWDPGLGLDKTRLRAECDRHGIDTRPFFSPLSSLPAYRGIPGIERYAGRNPVAYQLGDCGINLPSSLALTEDQADFVCGKLKELLAKFAGVKSNENPSRNQKRIS